MRMANSDDESQIMRDHIFREKVRELYGVLRQRPNPYKGYQESEDERAI